MRMPWSIFGRRLGAGGNAHIEIEGTSSGGKILTVVVIGSVALMIAALHLLANGFGGFD